MDIWCIITFGFVCNIVYDVENGPLQLSYKKGDILQVKFRLENIPKEYKYFIIHKVSGRQPAYVNTGQLNVLTQTQNIYLNNEDNLSILEITFGKWEGFEGGSRHQFIKLINNESKEKTCINNPCTIRIDWKKDGMATPEATVNDGFPTEYYYKVTEIEIHPHIVYFKDNDILNVVVDFKNVHDLKKLDLSIAEYANYQGIQTKKEPIKLKKDLDDHYLQIVVHTLGNKKILLNFIHLKYNESRSDESCLAHRCKIVLDWNNTYLDGHPRDVSFAGPTLLSNSKPTVTPSKFKDDGTPYVVLTCTVIGQPLDILIWYQVKDGQSTTLRMYQAPKGVGNNTPLQLTLNKTLEDYDNDSGILCAKKSGPLKREILSDPILLTFKRKIPMETAFVSITPDSDTANFDVNSIMNFECSGSKPLDGRSLTWYIEDLSSTNFNLAINQSYDWNTNKNVLTLHLNESYNLKKIYCTQEYHMIVELRDGGGLFPWNYGEKVRSHSITLEIYRGDQKREQDATTNGANLSMSSKETPMLAILIALLIITVVLIVLGVWVARRRRKISHIADNQNDTSECNYATAQVTYAILDIPTGSDKVPPRKEASTPYVEIVGIYKPKPDKNKK